MQKWHLSIWIGKSRTLASMAIAADNKYFHNNFKDLYIGDLALTEDDVPFMRFMLQHDVHRVEGYFVVRSVAMALLLKNYYPITELDTLSGNQLHCTAEWGAIVDDDLPDFYRANGVDPLLENKEGTTPLHLLAAHSYRYIRR